MMLSHLNLRNNQEQREEKSLHENTSKGIPDMVRVDYSNIVVKQEMAEALLSQGLTEEAVSRLLHIDPEIISDND
jgi:hypothetical protein